LSSASADVSALTERNQTAASIITSHKAEQEFAQQSTMSNTPGRAPVTSISAIVPYLDNWTIKAHVRSKSNLQEWTKPESNLNGTVFSFVAFDESGEINIRGFNQQVNRFYELILPEKVYYISKCSCNLAKEEFNETSNKYELTLNPLSTIEVADD